MIKSMPMAMAAAVMLVLFFLFLILFRVSLFGVEGEAEVMDSVTKGGQVELRYSFHAEGVNVTGTKRFGIAAGQWKSGFIKVVYLKSNPKKHLAGGRGCLPRILTWLAAGLCALCAAAALSERVLDFLDRILPFTIARS